MQSGTLQEHSHELMRVPGEAVRPLDPIKPVLSVSLTHQQTSAPGSLKRERCNDRMYSVLYSYINVHPDSVLLTDVRYGIDGVEGPDDGGAGSAVDEKGLEAPCLVLGDQPFQVLRAHPASPVNSHLATVVRAEAQGSSCTFDGIMALNISL